MEREGGFGRMVVKIRGVGLASPRWAEKRGAERMLRFGDEPDADFLASCPAFEVERADRQSVLGAATKSMG